ncbi:putative laccase [Tanacetum coccineum]
MSYFSGTESRLRPYHFNYPERSLTMEEMLNKFIDEGKREHEEMRAFIYDFQTNNELLFKERNNSLIELRFGMWKAITLDVRDNDTSVPPKEPIVVELEKPAGSNEDVTNDQPQITSKLVVQPSNEVKPPPVPFPKRLRKEKDEAQQKKFLENLKQLYINLPFIEALAQMPKSIQYPRGIIENVLIKVDKFILPIDFVILDMPEDSRVPIILGRSFLATARAMIDMFNKKVTLRVGDDEVIFDVDQSIKRPTTEDDECYRIDDLDEMINEEAHELLINEEPNSFLSRGLEKSIDQSDLECYESTSKNEKNRSDSENSIRRINSINTPYPVTQGITNGDNVKSEHLYSASANEIDEKKPELKNLP